MGTSMSTETTPPEGSMSNRSKRRDTMEGSLLHQHLGSVSGDRRTPDDTFDRVKVIKNLLSREEFLDDMISKTTTSTEPDPDVAVDSNAVESLDWFNCPTSGASLPTNHRGRAGNCHVPSHNSDPQPLASSDVCQGIEANPRLRRKAKSLPLKCPPRTRTNRSNLDNSSQPQDDTSLYLDQDEENDHLQHLYDMRTWDMYHRITQARRQQKNNHGFGKLDVSPSEEPSGISKSSGNIFPPSQIESLEYGEFSSPEDTEPIPIEVGGSMAGHEMMFGDLE